MMQEIFIVDAFAERPYTGNPAAVCLLDQAREDRWMQAVAAEMNLSETAFLVARDTGAWELRWFTPKTEVDLCGHATLASAHVLWSEFGVGPETLRFHTRSGRLTAVRDNERIGLDFPADPPTPVSTPDGLIEALNAEPESVYRGREVLLVVLTHAAELCALEPDMGRLARLDARGVIVTAESDRSEYDFVSRFFAPRAGIPEDPVTGSAHCTLGLYWGERFGKSALQGFQTSARGGTVAVRLKGERVELWGRAVTTLKCMLYA
ncbi:MAG: PhzF family phenazine biosynthesis protein [Pseudomonadota bacterium]